MTDIENKAYEAGKIVGEAIGFHKGMKVCVILLVLFATIITLFLW